MCFLFISNFFRLIVKREKNFLIKWTLWCVRKCVSICRLSNKMDKQQWKKSKSKEKWFNSKRLSHHLKINHLKFVHFFFGNFGESSRLFFFILLSIFNREIGGVFDILSVICQHFQFESFQDILFDCLTKYRKRMKA